MAFTPYYAPYQPGSYQPTMPDPMGQMRQNQQFQPPAQMQVQQQTSPILWVQGEEAAKAYMVAPGNSVLLMDSEGSTFYLKSSDAQGMPMPLRIFDYTERTVQKPRQLEVNSPGEYVTRTEFETLAARLDALAGQSAEKKKAKEDAENA